LSISSHFSTVARGSQVRCELANRDLTILGRQRDGNGYQYNRSLKIIEKLEYMNDLDIVLALFTTPNHRFSRLDTTAAFQATTSAASN
jgi:hypothetical protein